MGFHFRLNLHKKGQEVRPNKLLNSGNVTVKLTSWEPTALYRVFPYLDLGAGGRLNNFQGDIDVRRNLFPIGTEQVIKNSSKTWFYPIVIERASTSIKEKWLLQARGDLGGFSAGSDFTWQLQAYAGYRFTKVCQLSAGYRILSTHYDKGTGENKVIYNMDISGPVIRLGFNF